MVHSLESLGWGYGRFCCRFLLFHLICMAISKYRQLSDPTKWTSWLNGHVQPRTFILIPIFLHATLWSPLWPLWLIVELTHSLPCLGCATNGVISIVMYALAWLNHFFLYNGPYCVVRRRDLWRQQGGLEAIDYAPAGKLHVNTLSEQRWEWMGC